MTPEQRRREALIELAREIGPDTPSDRVIDTRPGGDGMKREYDLTPLVALAALILVLLVIFGVL